MLSEGGSTIRKKPTIADLSKVLCESITMDVVNMFCAKDDLDPGSMSRLVDRDEVLLRGCTHHPWFNLIASWLIGTHGGGIFCGNVSLDMVNTDSGLLS